MTNFDHPHLMFNLDQGHIGGTVYNKNGTPPTADHYIVGGLATITLPKNLWQDLSWDTRSTILSTLTSTFKTDHPDTEPDTLGFWLDGDYLYWDLGTIYFSETAARNAAIIHNEKSFYSTATDECIPTDIAL